MSKLKGYRTLIINGLTAVATIGALLTGQVSDPETLKAIILVVAVANAVLRFLTDTPVGAVPKA